MQIFDKMQDLLLVSEAKLLNFSVTAPHRYKVYEIAKRSGKGTRTIAHPSKELKFIQRVAVSFLEDSLPIHESAYAYRKGISIKDNAECHLGHKYLLKMDLKDFFPSITPSIFIRCLKAHDISLNEKDLSFIINIFFWKLRRNSPLRLSIGAPSSPMISNFVMFGFDRLMDEYTKSNLITYTRYADDLTFSSNEKNVLFSVQSRVRSFLKSEFGHGIKINTDKTIFSSSAHNRHVTGVTLTNDGFTSLGRSNKRKIFAAVHHYSLGKLSADEVDILRGTLAYASHIDPKIHGQLVNKYGEQVIATLKKII